MKVVSCVSEFICKIYQFVRLKLTLHTALNQIAPDIHVRQLCIGYNYTPVVEIQVGGNRTDYSSIKDEKEREKVRVIFLM